MNRNEEFRALCQELEAEAPDLSASVQKAKSRRRRTHLIVRPLAGLAAVFAAFVLLVNLSTPVAYACSRIPVLRELAEAVTFSRSLSDAVAHKYVQGIDQQQSDGDITVTLKYLIVDDRQVNLFYTVTSDRWPELLTSARIFGPEGTQLSSISGTAASKHGFAATADNLRCLTVDLMDEAVPGSLDVELTPYLPMDQADFSCKALSFHLDFDPEFRAAAKVIPVNRTFTMDGQSFTVTELEVYPTHLRVNLAEDEGNTAWLTDLDFYIETDWGMKFEPVSSGITASGAESTRSMLTHRADSTYFYEADRMKLVVTGAEFLDKNRERIHLNLTTGQSDPLPEGITFDSALRRGSSWSVRFRVTADEAYALFQPFRFTFYDAEGNAYRTDSSSTRLGDSGEGEAPWFLLELPLPGFPFEDVWLCPVYSRSFRPDGAVVIPVC